MYKVDKGIKKPNGNTKYPFHLMEVGDSFFVPFKPTTLPATTQGNIMSSARNYFGEAGHITAKRMCEDGVYGLRVWKIERKKK